MKVFNVLVTGCSSYGVGEGLIKTINISNFKKNIVLIGASNSDLTAYKDLLDKYYILPNAYDETYLEKLCQLIKLENIDILIPGSEAEMEVLAKNKLIFKDVDIWVNSYNIMHLFNDKSMANEFFQVNNIRIPEGFSELSEVNGEYPLIVKPIHGKSSENIYVVENNLQLKSVVDLLQTYQIDFTIQKFIDNGEEYTVSLINLNEDDVDILIMKRILCKGATQYAIIEDNEKIRDIILKIHNLIKEELILNVQLIKKNNEYFILEINPRFSGSAPMRAMLGFNEFDILFSHRYMKTKLEYNLLKDKYVIRGYKEFTYQI